MLEAFLGRPASVRSMYDLLNPATVPPDVPAFSDGSALYVRPSLACGGTAPFSLYKLVALHAAAHERFGSFDGHEELEPDAADADPLGAALADRASASDDLDRFLLGVCRGLPHRRGPLPHAARACAGTPSSVLQETYGHLDAGGPSGESGRLHAGRRCGPTWPPSASESAVLAPTCGVRRGGGGGAPARISRAPSRPTRWPRRIACAELVEPLWDGRRAIVEQEQLLDLPGADPPYHDHLLLGLTLAAWATGTAGGGLGTPLPGRPLDVPGSLHPSEVIEGLEIRSATRPQEIELLARRGGRARRTKMGSGECEIFHYHEWDHAVGDHRTRWCTVRERPQRSGRPETS